jgi:UDP-N-acetylglucosamine 2-epimerase (non-hydrolysing)
METYHLSFTHVTAIDPVGYLDFLSLEMHAALIVTDSGGIQEEACILQVPCITIRENTERPETITVGANMLVGLDVQRFIKAVAYHRNHAPPWENPFGDGKTAERILEVLASQK